MTITKTETQIFEEAVDDWVLEAIARGAKRFNELVALLPGVYPSVALISLQRLASTKKIPAQVLANFTKFAEFSLDKQDYSPHQITLPVPHPLDYDWRFSDTTIQYLLDKCAELTHSGEIIALLGTPSLLRMGIEKSYSRQLILLEASRTITDSFASVAQKKQVIRCDLIKDPLPNLLAVAAVLDPPWYPEHIQSFLWAACQLCKIGGYIFISMPPVGTRPGIEQEWANILDWAEQIGLTLVKLELAVLSYMTSPFEINVLKAEGLHTVLSEWRRGNLAVFLHSHQTKNLRPIVRIQEDQWIEQVLFGVRIRVRQPNLSSFTNPSLISVVPGDVLQSVSRRDSRRQLADVWTSGNRIFACQGRGVLWHILRALALGRSPNEILAATLKRPLNQNEAELVFHTANQIIDIVSIEQKENLFFE